ncbi:MAG: hypothetical protein R2818_14320 [Flavobacteriales bacterium]
MIAKRPFAPEQAYLLFGHLLFLGLFALAAIHHVERTIHVDSAFQIFKWVQLDEVEVEAHRYTAILPQLLVKLGKGLGIGLNGLLMIASLAHVAVAYLIFLLGAYLMRTPWIAVAVSLSAVLCTRLTFYGIVLEANYLLCYPLLLASVVQSALLRKPGGGSVVATAMALLLVLLVHPLGFLVALAVLIWYYLATPGNRKQLLVLIGIALVWGMLGRVIFPPSTYEAALYGSAADGLLSEVPGANAAMGFLFGHSWRDTTTYLPFWLLAFAVLFMLVRDRAWPLAMLFALSIGGYILLNALTYRAGESAMMMEKNFLPLAVLVAFPLFSRIERLPVRTRWWLLIPFVAVVFVQFRGVSFASRPAKERVDLVRAMVADARAQGHAKVAVPSTVLDAGGYHVHWALPFESLLLSGIVGPANASQWSPCPLAEKHRERRKWALPLADPFATDLLDQRFFTLPKETTC